jgi:hypothetical protein
MTQRTPDAGKTMADREMLELAALAMGIPVYESTDGTIQNRPILAFAGGGGMGTMPYEIKWDPRFDDAQAFRLAVKLRLLVLPAKSGELVTVDSYTEIEEATENARHDPHAATRLAITRAAAEVGRAMRDAGEHQ